VPLVGVIKEVFDPITCL